MGGREESGGGTGSPCTCPGAPCLRGSGEVAGGPRPRGPPLLEAGLARRRPSRFPGCRVREGGWWASGSRVPGASPWPAPRGLQAVSGPALTRAGHIWPARARLASPRRPEGACLWRAPDAEPGGPGRAAADLRPGLRGPEGPGRRAAAAAAGSRGRVGRRAAGSGRGAGPPGRGRCFWGKFPAWGEGGHSQACLRATVLFPEKLFASLDA